MDFIRRIFHRSSFILILFEKEKKQMFLTLKQTLYLFARTFILIGCICGVLVSLLIFYITGLVVFKTTATAESVFNLVQMILISLIWATFIIPGIIEAYKIKIALKDRIKTKNI